MKQQDVAKSTGYYLKEEQATITSIRDTDSAPWDNHFIIFSIKFM